ncbi:MAG TPA: phage holin family protein [Chitinophagales bacterium]|nr:phage holin family protein [Chitinophagales bacterium]
MAEKNLGTWWKELREELTEYLKARAQLTKLEAYEKIAKVVGVMISFFILALLVGFVIIFILIMIGSWIAELTGRVAIGFSSVALLVVGLFIFLSVKRKSVLEKPVSRRVIEALFDEEEFFSEKSAGDEQYKKDLNDNEE